jgi:hypothetical protein
MSARSSKSPWKPNTAAKMDHKNAKEIDNQRKITKMKVLSITPRPTYEEGADQMSDISSKPPILKIRCSLTT